MPNRLLTRRSKWVSAKNRGYWCMMTWWFVCATVHDRPWRVMKHRNCSVHSCSDAWLNSRSKWYSIVTASSRSEAGYKLFRRPTGRSGVARGGPIHISGEDNLWQKQNNNQIIFGNQNNQQNQIPSIIIYHEDNLYPDLDYFIRKKSDYVLDFCLTEINNAIF